MLGSAVAPAAVACRHPERVVFRPIAFTRPTVRTRATIAAQIQARPNQPPAAPSQMPVSATRISNGYIAWLDCVDSTTSALMPSAVGSPLSRSAIAAEAPCASTKSSTEPM